MLRLTNRMRQKGFTILLLAVALLLISTMLILFAAEYSSLQLKITANLLANQEAFEAAEAGLEIAIPYFQANYSAITTQANGGFLQPYVNSNTSHVPLANNATYSFVFSNPTANNYNLITITATGTSPDGSANRTLVQQIYAYSTGAVPNMSAETQGAFSLNDTTTLTNISTNFNIKTGGVVTILNGAQTITNAGVTSTASSQGNDILSNQSTLSSQSADDFFQNYFGVTPSALQTLANYTYTNGTDTTYNNLNGVNGAIIWINQIAQTAFINGSTVIGTQASPVILVIDGNLTLSGFATIFGIVFILNPSSQTQISNNATINGALASTASISLLNNSTLTYNAPVLYHLPATGAAPSYAKIPASWRDF